LDKHLGRAVTPEPLNVKNFNGVSFVIWE